MTKRLILALLFSSSPLWATTYYVDNCVSVGSDRNNGTSTSTPWLTINKVNTSKFNPGDSILFESTCTWREQLTVPSSGSARSPITFGAYGTGALPIFDGSAVVSTWTAAGVSYPNVWSATVAATPNAVFNNNVFATQAASEAALTEGQWFANGTTLYYYESAGNPSSQGYTIAAPARKWGINSNSQSYLTIQNIQIQKGNSSGIQVGISSNILINGVKSYYNAQGGIYITGPVGGPTQTGFTVTNSDLAYNGQTGFSGATYLSNLEISYNKIHNNCQLPVMSGALYMYDTSVQNVTIEYNEVYSNGLIAVVASNGTGIWSDTLGSGVVIRYNQVYGNVGNGIYTENNNGTEIYGNLVYSNASQAGNAGITVTADASGLASSNNLVYSNTVYGNGLGIRLWGCVGSCAVPGTMIGNQVENNISVGNTGAQLAVTGAATNTGGYGSGNVYLYNDFGPQGTNFIEWLYGVHYSTYAAWESAAGNCGTPGCSHSVQADPQFASAAASQFWLGSGSPAIDAGLNLGSPYNIALMPGSTWPNSVVTGDQNAYGSGWEIGAFIYVPPVAPATSLQVVKVN
jgi:hypothetical protein